MLLLSPVQPVLIHSSSFHDPEQDSVFANSDSVAAFSTWSLGATAKANSGSSTPLPPPVLTAVDLASCIAVRTESGDKLLPSLVTPRSAQGKRIRYVPKPLARRKELR